jgi:hypothetical protein
MGSSKVRALLGGALVVGTLAFGVNEVVAGSAGTGEEAVSTKPDEHHPTRPAAANRLLRLQATPLALAGHLAARQHQATLEIRDRVARYVAARAEADAIRAANEARAARVRGASSSRGASAPASTGAPSGGDHADTLACIRAYESDTSGGYSAVNSSSGAGGAYQALPSTWDGYAGYARAEHAPPEVQDQWAREAIATAGTRPWAGSGC